MQERLQRGRLPDLLRESGHQTAIAGNWHRSLDEAQVEQPRIPTMDHCGFDDWFCSDSDAKIPGRSTTSHPARRLS